MLGALILPGFGSGQTQADARLNEQEADSAAATYNYKFPLLGKKVVERGFDVPYPFGISANFLRQKFDVTITDLRLSLGDAEMVPIDIVEFENAGTDLNTFNVRLDLWVLPFLNISGMYGDGRGRTSVVLSEPVSFSTEVEFRGRYYGFGIMGAYGIERWFTTVDWSQTWFDTDLLHNPVLATIASIRAGRSFPVGKMNVNFWVGMMYQDYANLTEGTVTADQIFGGALQDALEGYQDTEWYQDLGRPQQAVVDEIFGAIQAVDPSAVRINYGLDKRPTNPRNLLVGARWEFSKRWELRVEGGFIGRKQLLASLAFHWPW